MEYKTEEEFLKAYDSSMFEKLSLTTDIAIFSVSNEETDNYRKLSKKFFSVLLVKRDDYPFKDKWCLPGGFVSMDETTDEAAVRVLKWETNLDDIYLEQLYTFSGVNRDPRMRIVSTSYIALIDKNNIKVSIPENAAWFNINFEESDKEIKVVLDNGEDILKFKIGKKLRDKTTDRYDYVIKENNDLAFDHPLVIASGVTRLKNKIEYTDIVFNMMPKEFTLGELQQVYEVILDKKLLDPAFRRIIEKKVEKTGNYKQGGGHRPSALFRLKK